MRPLTADTLRLLREPATNLGLQQRGVVSHLDVEHADQLLAFGIGRHARGSVLLAQDRERAIGQRIDIGHLGIADRELDEARVGAHVLGFADIDGDRRGALGAADRIVRCASASLLAEEIAAATSLPRSAASAPAPSHLVQYPFLLPSVHYPHPCFPFPNLAVPVLVSCTLGFPGFAVTLVRAFDRHAVFLLAAAAARPTVVDNPTVGAISARAQIAQA